MKHFFQILSLLFFAFLYSSCQDPCEDVDCYNGGWCDDGDCECPPGTYGDNCQWADASCTCTIDATFLDGMEIPANSIVTECIGCNSDDTEAFEQACTDSDAILNAGGVSLGSCVID